MLMKTNIDKSMKVELLKQIIEIGDPIEADTVTKSKDL